VKRRLQEEMNEDCAIHDIVLDCTEKFDFSLKVMSRKLNFWYLRSFKFSASVDTHGSHFVTWNFYIQQKKTIFGGKIQVKN